MQATKCRKAQASFEYLAIFTVTLLILVPFIYFFQNYSAESAENINYNTVKTIGNDIINSVETVYYMGYPARLTLEENFPSGIKMMNLTYATDVSRLTFEMYSGGNLSFYTSIPVNSTISPRAFSAGNRRIVAETRRIGNFTYVELIFQ